MIDFLFRITEQKARSLWRYTAQVHCVYAFVAGSRQILAAASVLLQEQRDFANQPFPATEPRESMIL